MNSVGERRWVESMKQKALEKKQNLMRCREIRRRNWIIYKQRNKNKPVVSLELLAVKKVIYNIIEIQRCVCIARQTLDQLPTVMIELFINTLKNERQKYYYSVSFTIKILKIARCIIMARANFGRLKPQL